MEVTRPISDANPNKIMSAPPKKPYCRPVLRVYGAVSKLTMSGAGSTADGGGGGMMHACMGQNCQG